MLEISKKFCMMGEHGKHLSPIAGRYVIIVKPGYLWDYVYREDRGYFLDLLEELKPQGKTIMDVGTGAGFVAIAAARLGASLVVGVEPHEGSAEFARQNVILNGLKDKVTIIPHIFDAFPKQFDIILNNTAVLDTYLEVLPDLEPRLATGGVVLIQTGGDFDIMRVTQGGFPIGMNTMRNAIDKSLLEIYDSVTRNKYEYWYLRRRNG